MHGFSNALLRLIFLFLERPLTTYNWSFFIKLLEITVLQHMINMLHYFENSALLKHEHNFLTYKILPCCAQISYYLSCVVVVLIFI